MFRLTSPRAYIAPALLVFLFGLLLAFPAISAAQAYQQRLSADSILAQFERDGGGLRSGYVRAMRVLTQPDSFPTVLRDSLLNGFERIALVSPNTRVRGAAVTALAAAAADDQPRPVSGVPARLSRIYAGNGEGYVRALVRSYSSRLADRPGAVRLLRHIVIEEDEAQAAQPPSNFDEAIPLGEAIGSLSQTGAEGRAALRDLHRNKRLRSNQGKERLDQLSRQGFDSRRRPE